MQNFEKNLSGDMAKMYLFTKFGINMHDGFWENGIYGRRTDDGRPRDDSSSAVH